MNNKKNLYERGLFQGLGVGLFLAPIIGDFFNGSFLAAYVLAIFSFLLVVYYSKKK